MGQVCEAHTRAFVGACLVGCSMLYGASVRDYGKVPLFFEANAGQAGPDVRFLSRGGGHALLLRSADALLVLGSSDREKLTFRWVNAQSPVVSGEDRQPGVSNYLIGSDRSAWRQGVPHYGRVRYTGMYRGIDVVYYGKEGALEYDLVVAPGADPSQARFAVEGAKGARLSDSGDLLLRTSRGDVVHRKPVAYQKWSDATRNVPVEYVIAANGEIGFRVGPYDRGRELVIDPVVAYSAYFGGTLIEQGESVAVDAQGAAYVTGWTPSTSIGVVGAAQGTYGGGASDAFVLKLNAAGTQIVYATYYGGTGTDLGQDISLDSTGSAWVVGETNSTNLPGMSGPRTTLSGPTDGFLIRLSASGAQISFGTYIGGSGSDRALAVVADPAGTNIYVAGATTSTDLPSPTGGSTNAGSGDGFLMKLTNNAVAWSVYAGGTAADTAYDAAVAPDGSVYVVGDTQSTNIAGAAWQPANRGSRDAMIVKYSPTGVRQYWAYLGGADQDVATGVAVDSAGNVYVGGETRSADFPRAGAQQNALGGDWDAFVTKLNPLGTAIVYSTYLGGASEDRGNAIAVDGAGNAYVAGQTLSTNFPVVASAKSSAPGGSYDAFVTKFNAAGSAHVYSSTYGGSGSDIAFGIAVDSAGSAYIAGRTLSPDLPAPLTGTSLKGQDAFVAKLVDGGACTPTVSPTALAANAGGGSLFVTVTAPAGCAWTASSASAFATISGPAAGTGTGFVTVNLQANPGLSRTGTLTIAGRQVPISQEGSVMQGCTYTVGGAPPVFQPSGGTGQVAITPSAGNCTWGAYSSQPWLQVFPLSGTGNATITYRVFPNFSTSQRTATITAGGQSVTVTQAANPLTSNQRFVQLLYFNCIGRLPSLDEINFQVNEALNRGVPRGQLAAQFCSTEPEFNLFSRYVAGVYVGLLLRDAEYGGWLFQRTALTNGQVSHEQLVQNFIGSLEFQLAFGTLDNAAFIRLLYRNILGRDASDTEVAFQVAQLATKSRGVVASTFLNSAEFQNRSSARLTAFLLLSTLLLREPNPTEFTSLVQRLSGPNPTPVRTIMDEILATPEFAAVLQ